VTSSIDGIVQEIKFSHFNPYDLKITTNSFVFKLYELCVVGSSLEECFTTCVPRNVVGLRMLCNNTL